MAYHICGFHGHVSTPSDSNSDVRRGDRRGIVDSIPYHGNRLAVVLRINERRRKQ